MQVNPKSVQIAAVATGTIVAFGLAVASATKVEPKAQPVVARTTPGPAAVEEVDDTVTPEPSATPSPTAAPMESDDSDDNDDNGDSRDDRERDRREARERAQKAQQEWAHRWHEFAQQQDDKGRDRARAQVQFNRDQQKQLKKLIQERRHDQGHPHPAPHPHHD